MQINRSLCGEKDDIRRVVELLSTNKFGGKLARRFRFLPARRVVWLIECTIRSRRSLRQMMINGATSLRENARALRIVREISSFSARFLHSGPSVRFIRRASMEVKSPHHRLQIYMAILFSARNSMHPVDLPSFDSAILYVTATVEPADNR